MITGTSSAEAPISPATALARPFSLRAPGLALLVLAAAHFVLVPGHVFGGQRYGWDGDLTAARGLNPLVAWLVGSLLIAYIVMCDTRAARSLLRRTPDSSHTVRFLARGTVASIVAVALMWPGISPAPAHAALLPLFSAAMLVINLDQRRSGAWPMPVRHSTGNAPQRRPRRQLWRAIAHVGRGTLGGIAVLSLALGTWFFVPASTPPIVDAQG